MSVFIEPLLGVIRKRMVMKILTLDLVNIQKKCRKSIHRVASRSIPALFVYGRVGKYRHLKLANYKSWQI
jgi:hypothetical protein